MRRALAVLTALALTMAGANAAHAAESGVVVKPDTAPRLALDSSLPHDPGFVLARLAAGRQALGAGETKVLGRWVRVPVPAHTTPLETVDRLAARPDVDAAELNLVVAAAPVRRAEPVPPAADGTGDPLRHYQWHLDQAAVPSGRGGEGVVVAVLDTGVSGAGEDLACHTFVAEYDAMSGRSGPGTAADGNGHGTHVAGTVAQCTDNGLGVAGVAPAARIMPVRVLDAAGSGTYADLAAGIDWARRNGADVINMSLGGRCAALWPACSSAVVDEAIAAAAADDVVLVASAGNEGDAYVHYPANHPEVIAVGATVLGGMVAPYSNRGATLDLVAPGGDAWADDNGDGLSDGVVQETFQSGRWGYWAWAGTSFATPHVAGAAAVLRGMLPDAPAAEVAAALRCSAGEGGRPGPDAAYGYGELHVEAATVALAAGDFGSTPPEWPAGSGLDAAAVAPDRVALAWRPPRDCGGIAGYRLSVDGVVNTYLPGGATAATVTGLTPDTTYTFAVEARGREGRWTASPLVTATATPSSGGPGLVLDAGMAVGMVDPATGVWHLRDGRGAASAFYYGNPGDVPFMGDWDCDGEQTPGLYRQSDGFVYLRNSRSPGVADVDFYFGNPGDVPLAGDFDGDGCDTVSLYRPSEARVYVINRLGADGAGVGRADHSFRFGDAGDVPVVGDLDGDGADEVSLHRPATGTVHVRWELAEGKADAVLDWGRAGDVVFVADFDGNGRDELGLYRPAGTVVVPFSGQPLVWGEPHWIPIPVR